MEKAFSIRESIKSAWKLINNDNLFLLIGLILGYLVIYGLISTVQVLNKGGISGMISQLAGLFVSVVFSLGFIKVCLQIAKEEEPEFKAFKDVIPMFFTYLVASIISALPAIGAAIIAFIIGLVTIIAGHVIAGFSVAMVKDPVMLTHALQQAALPLFFCMLLFLIPAIYFKIRWMFFPYYIVDKNAGIMDSLRLSWAATKGNFWHIFLFGLTCFGLVIAGLIALVLGVFVAIPVIAMATALVYLQLDKAIQPKEVAEPLQPEVQA
ncbi:MAG: DUF975 family protein [Bacteroidota bacterium]|nr:DUF975 family protein [Bacteroidota bacterium]